MVAEMLTQLKRVQQGEYSFTIGNCDRSIGARISGEIAKRYGNLSMEAHPVKVNLTGTAGQSLGVWNAGGLRISLEGDANDYVGKGMAGGRYFNFPTKRFTIPNAKYGNYW